MGVNSPCSTHRRGGCVTTVSSYFIPFSPFGNIEQHMEVDGNPPNSSSSLLWGNLPGTIGRCAFDCFDRELLCPANITRPVFQ
jgi:hypothetical protein